MIENTSYDDADRAARHIERERLTCGLETLLHAKDLLASEVGDLSAALFDERSWQDLDSLLCDLAVKQGDLSRVINQIYVQEKLIDECR